MEGRCRQPLSPGGLPDEAVLLLINFHYESILRRDAAMHCWRPSCSRNHRFQRVTSCFQKSNKLTPSGPDLLGICRRSASFPVWRSVSGDAPGMQPVAGVGCPDGRGRTVSCATAGRDACGRQVSVFSGLSQISCLWEAVLTEQGS